MRSGLSVPSSSRHTLPLMWLPAEPSHARSGSDSDDRSEPEAQGSVLEAAPEAEGSDGSVVAAATRGEFKRRRTWDELQGAGVARDGVKVEGHLDREGLLAELRAPDAVGLVRVLMAPVLVCQRERLLHKLEGAVGLTQWVWPT